MGMMDGLRRSKRTTAKQFGDFPAFLLYRIGAELSQENWQLQRADK